MKTNAFDKLLSSLDKISELDSKHIAYQYCSNRLVPSDKLDNFYYVPNIFNLLENLNSELELHSHIIYSPKEVSPLEWKVVLEKTIQLHEDEKKHNFILYPSLSPNREIVDLTLRRINQLYGDGRFYSIVDKNKKNKSCCFGIENIDLKKPFYIVEGCFDCFALENSISCSGYYNISELLESAWLKNINLRDITVVLDHEISVYQQLIKLKWLNSNGYSLCLYPIFDKAEDLNEKRQRGLSIEEIGRLVKKNSTKPGLHQNYKLWKRTIVYYLIYYGTVCSNIIKNNLKWN